MANATKKTAAIALAAGLALSGSAGTLAAPAFAQLTEVSSAPSAASENPTSNDAPAPVASQNGAGIDSSQSLSLTLHKRKLTGEQKPGTQATGQTVSPVPGEGLAGVEYRLDLIQALDSNADWQKAAQIWDGGKANVADLNAAQRSVKTGTTGADGDVTFANLQKGLYRVVETKAPAGVVPAAPFLVYVPMTNADGTDWIYDVQAYPKNTENKVTKEVKDEWANAGDEYTYTLTTGVPTGTLTKYIVRDQLDAQLQAPSAGDVEVANYTKGTDYTVAIDGQQIEVIFTEAGLKKLQAGTNVETTIKAKTSGAVQHVPNQGTLIYNNGSSENDVEHPTNKTHSYWGNLKVTKTAEDKTTPLKGAEFELVRCEATAGTAGDTTWTQLTGPGAQSAVVDGKRAQKFTTGNDGTVTISGIHVEDFENNGAEDVKTNFCLKETKAPAGYIANDQLIPFELKRGEVSSETGAPVKTIEATASVVNFKSPNTLPNTGGMGVWILALAGLAIVGGGVYAARRNSQSA